MTERNILHAIIEKQASTTTELGNSRAKCYAILEYVRSTIEESFVSDGAGNVVKVRLAHLGALVDEITYELSTRHQIDQILSDENTDDTLDNVGFFGRERGDW